MASHRTGYILSDKEPIRRVEIRVIAHHEQRYETCGDWIIENDRLIILVSDLGDWRCNMLVAVHELIEVLLCHEHGISQEIVDKFDMEFERTCPANDNSEPGDDVNAPYKNEHCFATAVERMLCAAFGIAWQDYDGKVQAVK